jgi:hypothetical protein
MMLANYYDETLGRAPWPAADPLVGPLERSKSRTSLCCIVGQVGDLRRVANPPAEACNTGRGAPGCQPARRTTSAERHDIWETQI